MVTVMRLAAFRFAGAVAALATLAACGSGRVGTSSPSSIPSASPGPTLREVPLGWKVCVNTRLGFQIAFPGTWFTIANTEEHRCRWFDPKPIAPPPDLDGPDVAILVEADDDLSGFANFVDQYVEGNSAFEKVLTVERLDLFGKQALRAEAESTEDDNRGARSYLWAIDRGDGTALWVLTGRSSTGSRAAYARNKSIVDQAARTVEFFTPASP